MSEACENLTVVDFSQGMAGPMVTMILADHGADVIKVEPPTGDWARSVPGFQMWNRGKSSVVIDLSTDAGRRQARDLVAGADVVVEDFAPGRAEAYGLDYAHTSAVNPGLIHCAIAGYDDDGPLAGRKAYDGVVAAAVGRMVDLDALSGAIPDQDRTEPIFTVAPVATYGVAQLAVHGVLAALLARVKTGRGQRVDTSLLLGEAGFLMRQDMARGGEDRTGLPLTDPALHRGIVMCFLTAECSDGRYIQMCARQDHHFRNWMKVLEMEDIFDDPRYARAPLYIATVAEVVALEDRIRDVMRKRSQSEWMQIFIDGDVGADPFLLPEEFLQHPQMVENGRVVEIEDPELGIIRQVGPLVNMSDTPAQIKRPAPKLGQHTKEIATRPAGRPKQPAPAPAGSTTEGALAGVTIVELAYYVAGPLSSVLLAELGARVIKVEPLEGDPSRRTGMQNAKFLVGKDSIGVDLKSVEGRGILHQLIGSADALLHNFRPGVPERLGFGWAEAQQLNPRLVYLYGASYGSRGPQNRRAAFHSTPNALAGGGIQQAGRGNAPVDDSYPDPGSGLAAATALMLGLWAREVTGRGQYLETTMLTSAGYILSNNLVLYDGAPPMAMPDRGQHGLHALYRLYPAQTGWLFVAAGRDQEWQAMAKAAGQPGWLDDSRFATAELRMANDDALVELIGAALAGRRAEDWDRILTAAGVACAVASEVAVDKWFEDHGLLLAEDHPVFGPFWRAPPKVRLSANPPRMAPPSALGENTRPVLHELGYTDEAVDELVERGLVVEWRRPADELAGAELTVSLTTDSRAENRSTTTYDVISADSHVVEPHDLWQRYVEAEYRDRAPRLVHDADTDRLVCDQAELPPVGLLAGCARGDEDVRLQGRWETDVFRGGYDPEARLADLARDGVDGEILFPTIAMQMYPVADLDFQWSLFRAYNTWLAEEFCGAHPEVFWGIGMLNHEDVDRAVAEMERCHDLGLVGVMVPMFNGEDNLYHNPRFDRLWAAASEAGMPVNLHAATTRDLSKAWNKGTPTDSVLRHATQIQQVLLDMIFSGLFDRFPELMVVSAENDVGWAASMLERADYWWHRNGNMRSAKGAVCVESPSFYFHRNMRVTFMRDQTGVLAADIIGPETMMWGNDFPHHVSTWPHSTEVLAEHFDGRPGRLRERIVRENVRALYHI